MRLYESDRLFKFVSIASIVVTALAYLGLAIYLTIV